ncbi:hypothetical protein SUGI_0062520 [Cryptomeria japonica]|uniref:uncharacterized protein LOC131073497 n=1 Tax=Cryptomeria japonica TaxID=3369 RepID=UPI002408B667|nr:uncharacterized protein LOC131073497 [Cryptomeria japonica]XP_057865918.2 uncharacterized protein LOC131073497 [Cryptomeria japonica]XP_057865919.2 uncharacterized protein LOC131073497 [Cryptomeria japonica]GLJ07238.1 hypothetical protein SUGI_0062520 [Cryptomeria japonica]
MCLQFVKIGLPISEGSASSSSEESLSSKYEIALKRESLEEFSNEVHRTIDHTLSQSSCDGKNFLGDLILHDEDYVNTHVLPHYISEPELQKLLSHYFSNTQNAFELCALLLKCTHRARMNYRTIQDVIGLMPTSANFDFQSEECRRINSEFMLFVEQENPFGQASDFEVMCDSLEKLHQLLELRRENKFDSVRDAEKQRAQLDAAARWIYVLKNHLRTTRMLVARLYDEVEHSKTLMRIYHARENDVYPLQQVGRLLEKNDSKFGQRLNEIEEQGCLCLHNINRARELLLHQIHH